MAHQRDIKFINGPMATVMTVKATGRMYKLVKSFGRNYTLIDMQTTQRFNIVAPNGWSASGQAVKQLTKWEAYHEKEKANGKHI